MLTTKNLSIAYTPDSDDAFYYYALQCGKLATPGYNLSFSTDHIIALNRSAVRGEYDICAVSSVAYPNFSDSYRILSVGTSVGRGYGPVLVSKHYHTMEDLSGRRVGVAGIPTTGGFLQKWACPDAEIIVMQFDQIADCIASGELDAGVMIHEELLYYPQKGLHKIVDLGACWEDRTGLPLPVGLNVIKRDIPRDEADVVCDLIRNSLVYGLQNRKPAIEWACRFGRGEDGGCGEEHISMFANDDSVMMPTDVRIALAHIFELSQSIGITETKPEIDIVDGSATAVEQARKLLAA
jgi:1,4-dihydroxy-6-naphthoate synthase